MELNQIILLHEDFLSDFGYTLGRKQLRYTKKFAEGKQIIFFHHTHYQDALYVEYHLGIRFDEVETIIHKFLPTLGDYKDRSITLIETLDHLSVNMPRRYFLENDAEIRPVISKVEDFLVKEGFNWLDRFANGIELEKLFNDDPGQQFTTQSFTYRASRGITLARLYNQERYKAVKDVYLAKLEEMQVTPFTVACFLNLIDYLDNME